MRLSGFCACSRCDLLAPADFHKIPLAVTLEVPGFTVTSEQATQTVTQGSSAAYTVNVESLLGFDQAVELASFGALPAGVTMTFAPTSVTGTGASTLTVATTDATPTETHTLAFTGTAGEKVVTVTITLTVNAPAPPGGGFDDFPF